MKRHPLVYVVLVWIISVLSFASIYSFVWARQPDAFILHKEFNLTPYEELNTLLWSPDCSWRWGKSTASGTVGAADIEEFMKSVRQLEETAKSALSQLELLRTEQQRLEADLKVAIQRHSNAMWSNVERYRAAALNTEEEDEKSAAQRVKSLEEAFGLTPNSQQALIIADARVASAQASYRAAVKRADVGEYVLKNLAQFAEPATASATAKLFDSLKENGRRQSELTLQISQVRDRAYSSLRDWYTARQPRLDWIDFLYFSVGVSTTTTFGDIVPNSRTARVVVLVQLVASVLIVGYLLSLIAPRQTGP